MTTVGCKSSEMMKSFITVNRRQELPSELNYRALNVQLASYRYIVLFWWDEFYNWDFPLFRKLNCCVAVYLKKEHIKCLTCVWNCVKRKTEKTVQGTWKVKKLGGHLFHSLYFRIYFFFFWHGRSFICFCFCCFGLHILNFDKFPRNRLLCSCKVNRRRRNLQTRTLKVLELKLSWKILHPSVKLFDADNILRQTITGFDWEETRCWYKHQ